MPINKNLHLHHEDTYQSIPIMTSHLPMVFEWLGKLHGVIHHSLKEYGRVFAFRVDFRLPENMGCNPIEFKNTAISTLWELFNSRIKINRMNAQRQYPRAHDSKVHYFWVREVGLEGHVHYHALILLNGHAFSSVGDFYSLEDNMINRLTQSWATALGISFDEARPLVHLPKQSTYRMTREDVGTIQECFRRSSYLCKAETKSHGFGHHSCGSSRY